MTRHWLRALPCAVALLVTSAVVMRGADEKPETPPATAALVIQGADLYTITNGVIRGGTIVLEGGKITALGTGVSVPDGAEVIDARGKTVMPGLVAARLSGLLRGDSKKIADALSPYSSTITFALASGVTAGYVQAGGPADQPFGGTNAVVKVIEGDLDGMLLREPADLNLRYANSDPRSKALLRQQLRGAKEYLRKKAQFDQDKAAGKEAAEPAMPPGGETLTKLLTGELAARVSAQSSNDILSVVQLVDDFGIRLILEGPVEGWTVAEAIARRHADVIMTPRTMVERDRNVSAPTGSSNEQAAILARAGVRLAIVPPNTSFELWGGFGQDLFTLPLEAAHAVGGGLPEDRALAAITINPAEMMGVGDRIGSLQVGKDADLIVMDGHPLDYRTFVELTIVNGKVLYDKSRSRLFSAVREKSELPQAEPVQQPDTGGSPAVSP